MIACSAKTYGLGIGLRAAIMTRGQRSSAITAARRSVPRQYHLTQPLTFLLIRF